MALTTRFQAPVSGLTGGPWYVRPLTSTLDFRVLGPLEVVDGERSLSLGGTKQRGVLAILLLRAGEVVSSDRLIEELWGDHPPADAQTALQQHVSRLRRQLHPHAVLATRAPGYVLEIESEQLDLERFRALGDRGRHELEAGAPDAASRSLRAALELWRGPVLADLADENFVRDAARALEDERLDAVELRIHADLEGGRHAEIVGELSTLVREHPLRERLRAQQMLALYRSGRQSDALQAYADGRRALVEEFGLEPGPELQELQQRILTHDEALRAPESPERRRRRRWVVLAATATASALLATVAVGLVLRGGEGTAASGATAGDGVLIALDAESGDVERRLPAGRSPSAVAVGEGAIWLVDADARTLLRIAETSRVVETLATGATPVDVAVGAGYAWILNGRRLENAQFVGPVGTALARLDPVTRTERSSTGLSRKAGALSNLVDNHVATRSTAVWVVAPDFSVSRVDASTGAVTATSRDVPAAAVATGPAGVWVLGVDGQVVRLEERTARVVRRASVAAGSVGAIGVGTNAAWVTVPGDGTLWRVGAGRAESLGAIQLERGISDVAVGPTGIWVANPIAGTVTHVDPQTSRVVRIVDVGGIPRSLTVDEGTVWVAVTPDPVASAIPEIDGVATFPASTCEPPLAGADGRADLLVTSDLPLQGGIRVTTTQMAQAIAFVLREHDFRAGRYRIAYQSCDDSVARTGLFDEAKCAANARAYAANPDVVGVIGTVNSPCAVAAIPELNRAMGGPLAMISPFNSFVGLTRTGPGVDPALPAALYPTGRRNYLRVFPTDDLQGAALALLARDRDRRRVFVLDDGEPGYGALLATAFETAALRLGLEVAGRAVWDPRAERYEALAERVARSGATAVFVGGLLDTNAGAVVRDLRRRLGRTVDVLGTDGLTPLPLFAKRSRGAAVGSHVSLAGLVMDGLPPAAAGWVERFAATQRGASVEPAAVYAAQAAEVLLDAIARSDGTRDGILESLFETRVEGGMLGSFGFDPNGDITESPVTILRVVRRGSSNRIASTEGGVIATVVRPSPGLVAADE